jgi:hypothetical protein
MHGLEFLYSLSTMWGGLWAYGPAPGVELIPYFLGLAAWMGMAFLAVLWAPFSALLRRLRGRKNISVSQEQNVSVNVYVQEQKKEEPAAKSGE